MEPTTLLCMVHPPAKITQLAWTYCDGSVSTLTQQLRWRQLRWIWMGKAREGRATWKTERAEREDKTRVAPPQELKERGEPAGGPSTTAGREERTGPAHKSSGREQEFRIHGGVLQRATLLDRAPAHWGCGGVAGAGKCRLHSYGHAIVTFGPALLSPPLYVFIGATVGHGFKFLGALLHRQSGGRGGRGNPGERAPCGSLVNIGPAWRNA
ncbi:hypothetical protein THAOC_06896 [Thalassiosira oceanica]|uniref:Uncharacterized protein n=1 Tax=Thalassiosira oceanica TaxID=159749 RepID=K0TL92_THAOC|nr:hypothetical protein THAOC_06896 [Thalassiosira oceanica]|eukprot:EJK71642.1 hypothetical protein THAOC_06896 [Thalassiosira oceanica]